MEASVSAVTDGTGGHARVPGFTVGGKSGTSEPPVGREYLGFIASFIGLAPAVDTQVVVLVIIHNPRAGQHHGGQVAGPVVSRILDDVLAYLGIPPCHPTAAGSSQTPPPANAPIILPDVRGRTITEARDLLPNFTIHLAGNEDPNVVRITDQLPLPGVYLPRDSDIFLFTEYNNEKTSTTVPNLRGMSLAQATNSLASRNLNIVFTGSGVVMHQDIAYGTEVSQGSVITVTLRPQLVDSY